MDYFTVVMSPMSARYTAPVFAACLFLLFFLLSTPTWAADFPPRSAVRLTYDRGELKRCPDEQVFRDVLRARMSYDPFSPEAEARLVVTIVREGHAYRGRAELRDRVGAVLWPRALGPFADCQSLVEGLGLAVSIKLDPGGGEGPTAPPPLQRPLPPEEEEETTAPAPSPRRTEELKVRPWIKLGASMVLGLGVAPRPAAGIAADIGFRLPSWPETLWVALELRAFPPAEGQADAGILLVRTWQVTGAAIPCGHWRMLFGCGVVEMGTLWGTTDALATGHAQTARLFHFSLGGRAGAEWQALEHLTLRVSADALFAPLRQALQVEGVPQWVAPILAGAFETSVVVSF
jgi:hypothetical protein